VPELTELLKEQRPTGSRSKRYGRFSRMGSDRGVSDPGTALTTGTAESRDATMQSLTAVRDERAALLFAYSPRPSIDHRGLLSVDLSACHRGAWRLKGARGRASAARSVYRGEWCAPRRTALLRAAAGTAAGAYSHALRPATALAEPIRLGVMRALDQAARPACRGALPRAPPEGARDRSTRATRGRARAGARSDTPMRCSCIRERTRSSPATSKSLLARYRPLRRSWSTAVIGIVARRRSS